jgi:hypothetical protein
MKIRKPIIKTYEGGILKPIVDKLNDVVEVGQRFGIVSPLWRPSPEPLDSSDISVEKHWPGMNWAGPNTKFTQRVQRGDIAVDIQQPNIELNKKTKFGVDESAYYHDKDYNGLRLAIKNKKITSLSQLGPLVRQADDIFLKRLATNDKYKDQKLQRFIIKSMFIAKKKLENMLILSPKKFITDEEFKNEEEINNDDVDKDEIIEGDGKIYDEKKVKTYKCCFSCTKRKPFCEKNAAWKLIRRILKQEKLRKKNKTKK